MPTLPTTPTSTPEWYCIDTEPVEGGASAGDYQVGEDITVRFRLREEPANDGRFGVITETWYVEDVRALNNGDEEQDPPRYGVMLRIEYMLCTDPDEPGSTEINCDHDYSWQVDGRTYDNGQQALTAARRLAVESVQTGARIHEWDGRTI